MPAVWHLNDIGFVGPDIIAGHSIHLNDDVIDITLKTGTGLVRSPESNMKLSSEIMRIPELLKRNAKVDLSTDGINDNLDVFEA